MERHNEVEYEDANRLTHDRKKGEDITESFSGHRDSFLKLLTEFESNGDGHLGRISQANIELNLYHPMYE